MKANLEQGYYNAGKVFQVTGQLQDPTPPDMRSESDKFALVEQNRQYFRTKLLGVTSGANSDVIVNDVPFKNIPRILQGWPTIKNTARKIISLESLLSIS